LVKWEKTGDHLIVARDLIDNLSTKLSHALDIIATFTGMQVNSGFRMGVT